MSPLSFKKSIFTILAIICLQRVVYSQDLSALYSHPGGIYTEESLTITLDTTGGTRFKYTLDGNDPSSAGASYQKPIILSKTTSVSIAVYDKGVYKGKYTQTYLLGRTYDMAVVSITVKPADFFSYDRGIYVKGCCADSVQPYRGANFWRGWERPINVELYEPDNTLAFNQPAGARIFGGFSKGLPMKSLAILAKSKYGPKKFKYQIFPNKDLKKYKSFVLRNSGGDFNKTHFRDALLTDLVAPLDLEIQAYRPAVLYINGEYWGIHNIREKINEHYLKYNCGANEDSVDIMKHRNDLQHGNRDAYKKLLKYIDQTDFSDTAAIRHLNTMMDIDNYINYNLAEIYSDNGDAGGNIRYWREQKPNARWRWILFDLDLGMGIGDWTAYKVNTLKQMTSVNNEIWPNPPWSTKIIRNLLENDSIKEVYINRFADHLNTIFSSENVNFKIDSIQNLIKNEMPKHFEKWPSKMEKWERNVDVLRDFASYRPSCLRTFIMEKFELIDTVQVQLMTNPKLGSLKINSLVVDSTFSGYYFNGCPIMIIAVPKTGYKLKEWKGSVGSSDTLIINPTQEINLEPIFVRAEMSEFNFIKINEMSIKQDSLTPSEDYVELYNSGQDSVDLYGWKILTKDDELMKINVHFKVAPKSYIIVAEDRNTFSNFYGDSIILLPQNMKFGISSKKDKIFLLDDNSQIADSLFFKTKEDFKNVSLPIILEKTNPLHPSQVKFWSAVKKGSPGKVNAVYEPMPDPEADEKTSSTWFYTLLIGVGGVLLVSVLLWLWSRQKRTVNSAA